MSNTSDTRSTIPLLPPPPSKTVVYQSKSETLDKGENDHKVPQGLVQNAKKSRVYVFGASSVAEEEINEQNSFELRPRGKNKPVRSREPQEVVLLDREIKEGDTLEKFALLYGCSIAELKQTNKISNGQDFFALRTIKIPVKKYGLLTESEETKISNRRTLAESEVTSPTESYKSINYSGDSDDSDVLYRKVSIAGSMEESEEGKKFLRSMDKDLEKIIRNTQTQKESLKEVASFLNGKSIHPLVYPKAQQSLDCRSLAWWNTKRTLMLYVSLFATVVLVIALYYFKRMYDKGSDVSSGSSESNATHSE